MRWLLSVDEPASGPAATGPEAGFFADRHIDARMRALVPIFARLGVVVVALGGLLGVHPLWRGLSVAADALLALVVTELAVRTGFVERARHVHVFCLLLLYASQITVAEILSHNITAFGVVHVLPIIFAAVFFSTPAGRYALPVYVAVLEYVAGRPEHLINVGTALVRLAALLLLAHFGVQLSEVLREAMRAHRSLHSVLEGAILELSPDELALRGAEVARATLRWDGAALNMVEPDGYRVAAVAGLPPDVVADYVGSLIPIGRGDLLDRVASSGKAEESADVIEVTASAHPVSRHGFQRYSGVPIRYHGEIIAVLIVFRRKPQGLDAQGTDRLRGVAEQLGLALGSSRAALQEQQVSRQLRELNQRKDEFLATISHELRTPATTIELAARTLMRAGDRLSPDESVQVRKALVSRSRQMRDLIESLLDLALSESGESRLNLGIVDWTSALTRWVADFEDRLGRPVTLELPDKSCVSEADTAKIERVLFNLVSNAAKFSTGDDAPITVRLKTAPTEVVISVIDEGMGILPGDIEKIFDPFLQLDGGSTREQGGLGIGLTLVRHFVRLHGGRVDVTSVAGEGSTFRVAIPRRGE
ncbi:MAG: two-component system, OmpR family, phosphate regulon sensor histidine kinase PhoR [Frankiales bacterium]|nr:two-component system, OmpR family, phosphate regulon sensor histidine kinase PhoR [Frankiales bacterium]